MRHRFVIVRIAVTAVVATAFVAGCSGDSGSARSAGSTSPSSSIAAPASPRLVSPAVFERLIASERVVTINVHVPDEGSIAGTDLTIPYDRIATSTALPADHATPLAVYCRSGNMSAQAVRDLVSLGYTDITELAGGFNAWTASGRALQTS